MHLVMPTLPYSPTHLKKTDLNRAVPLCILLLFCAFLQEKRGYPTPENAILHPILHPKSPIITGLLGYGCRKCRIFFQNFFRGGEKRHWSGGLGGRFTKLIYRTPLNSRTTVSSLPLKKVLEKHPTFPTPDDKTSSIY